MSDDPIVTGSLEYGKATLRAVFLLNGGAIVGMMTFIGSIVEKKPQFVPLSPRS